MSEGVEGVGQHVIICNLQHEAGQSSGVKPTVRHFQPTATLETIWQ